MGSIFIHNVLLMLLILHYVIAMRLHRKKRKMVLVATQPVVKFFGSEVLSVA